MVITKAGGGRPSRAFILEQVDLGLKDLAKTGGLPSPAESAEIWRNIWHEEAHNSTALEGNTLVLREVKLLLDEGRPIGNKDMKEYLEVLAYGQAAEWVYGQAIIPGSRGSSGVISQTEIRHIHEMTIEPVWRFFPPDGLDPEEGPGRFRRHDIAPFPEGMAPPSFTEVDALVTDWLKLANSSPAEGEPPLVHIARLHSAYERVHPFRDGNGRTGRLILNLVLVRGGYPPAIIRKAERTKYLIALRRADRGEFLPLAELIARAVKDSLDRFLLPGLAGPNRLLPLSALATPRHSAATLRKAAERGRLTFQRDEAGRYYGMKKWIDEYEKTARRGRPRKTATP